VSKESFEGFERTGGQLKGIKYYCMTEYDKSLTNVKVVYKKEKAVNNLGEFLEKRGYTQLRIAETEKYAHVTFFFNCGEETPNLNESRILVPSPQVATYDLKPEMSAYEVTEKVCEAIDSKKHDVIILNFANGDMVGHTGNFEAAVSAMEAVDECLGKIIDKLEEVQGEAIIIADHGNCEQMLDTKTGEVITSHTTFNVPIIVVSDKVSEVKAGTLTDVAPTLIDLTPDAVLPIHLIFSSENLTALPLLAAIITSSLPFVFLTANNSSPSFNVTAILPLCLIFLNSSMLTRLLIPLVLTNNNFSSPVISSLSIEIIARTFSFLSMFNKLIIGRPFDCLENSGILYPLILYTLPELVKNKTSV